MTVLLNAVSSGSSIYYWFYISGKPLYIPKIWRLEPELNVIMHFLHPGLKKSLSEKDICWFIHFFTLKVQDSTKLPVFGKLSHDRWFLTVSFYLEARRIYLRAVLFHVYNGNMAVFKTLSYLTAPVSLKLFLITCELWCNNQDCRQLFLHHSQ